MHWKGPTGSAWSAPPSYSLTPALILTDMFCGKMIEHEVESLILAKLGLGGLLGLFVVLVILPITFARWWLKTQAGTRLGKVWSWVIENLTKGFLIIAMGVSSAIDKAVAGDSDTRI